jgi:hypothetical protein
LGTGTEILDSALSRETGNTNRDYIYHTDADGTILYNNTTGDPLIIRPYEEGRDFQRDLNEWRIITSESLENSVQFYESRIVEFYPELLAFLDKDEREDFSRKLDDLGIKASQSFRNELKGILNREERYFTAKRLGDNYSLRKKSEDESAELVLARLIEETNLSLSEGLITLQKEIEAAEADPGDLALEGTDWLSQYHEQFERGLNAWEKAEEEFFIRRIQWNRKQAIIILKDRRSGKRLLINLRRPVKIGNWKLKSCLIQVKLSL